MRAAFGLVSILVVLAILAVVWAMPGGELDRVSLAKQAQDDTRAMVNEMSGRESTGARRKSEPLTFADPATPFRRLTITAIAPGSELAQRYGLRVGDEIKTIGAFEVGSAIVPTEDDARLQLDVLREVEPIVVVRGGKEYTLDPTNPATIAAAAATPTPAAPTGETELTGGPADPTAAVPPGVVAPTQGDPTQGEAAAEPQEQRGNYRMGDQLDAILRAGGGQPR